MKKTRAGESSKKTTQKAGKGKGRAGEAAAARARRTRSRPSPAPEAVASDLAPATGPRAAADSRRRRDSREAAEAALEAALDKKALMPVLLDVGDRASYTDFIGIVSGRSDRQVEAIADHITQTMEDRGHRLIGREGMGGGRWMLLDFGDVVVHVFYHPVRETYDIEGLWVDAPRLSLKVPPEAQLYQPDALYGAL